MTGNPIIDRWLAEQAPQLPEADQLSALLAATNLGHAYPDDVLEAWGHEVVLARRVVDQSEPAFIAEARRQGWSWERIAERLGLPDAETAEQRQAVLEAELIRTHPQNLPGAWRP
ncbi:hypothetical protein OG943_12165 [Amycolatopsis sp. NBC_00345]|uniref:hypothetical protein n=1 Tax=Amycolatopsis sp. NBC_00345 TaxID=2975955 RepID=UPI002E255D74